MSCASDRDTLAEEDSGSAFLGVLSDCLLIGGGDLRRGDTGHRGVSLISCPGRGLDKGLTGTGALMVESDWLGCSEGIDTADNAL